MAFNAREITRTLKRYDPLLFCAQSKAGNYLSVYRRIKQFLPVVDSPEMRMLVLSEASQHVLALTDNWLASGKRRDWGMDLILEKIKSMDLANNARLFEEFEAQEEREKASADRHLDNELEAWAKDSRRAFAKATDDILTHSLSKDEPRKRRKDRSIHNGNR